MLVAWLHNLRRYRSYRAKVFVRAYLAGPNVISATAVAGLRRRHPAIVPLVPRALTTTPTYDGGDVAAAVVAVAAVMLFGSTVPFPGATFVT